MFRLISFAVLGEKIKNRRLKELWQVQGKKWQNLQKSRSYKLVLPLFHMQQRNTIFFVANKKSPGNDSLALLNLRKPGGDDYPWIYKFTKILGTKHRHSKFAPYLLLWEKKKDELNWEWQSERAPGWKDQYSDLLTNCESFFSKGILLFTNLLAHQE